MPIAPEAIKAGHCYLTTDGRVRRVTSITPDGHVIFIARELSDDSDTWPLRVNRNERPTRERFASTVARQVKQKATKGDL